MENLKKKTAFFIQILFLQNYRFIAVVEIKTFQILYINYRRRSIALLKSENPEMLDNYLKILKKCICIDYFPSMTFQICFCLEKSQKTQNKTGTCAILLNEDFHKTLIILQ